MEMMQMTRALLTGCILLMACGSPPQTILDEDAELPPLSGMIAPVDSRRPLHELLEALEREIVAAQQARSDELRDERIFRAEAITDLLLEAEAPFAYLAEGYHLAARLRQLQTRADRIVAQIRRGRIPGRFSTLPFPTDEVEILRREVVEIRLSLARGGGPAPIPLDTLLARYRQPAPGAPAAPAQPAAPATGVLGQPATEP
jgi:hypothetical protein